MTGTVKKVGPNKWEARWREGGLQRKRRFRTKGMAEDAIRIAGDREERRKSPVIGTFGGLPGAWAVP